MFPAVGDSIDTHTLLNILQQKRRSPQIVDRTVEEPLNLLLVQVHRDDMRQTGLAHHLCQQLGNDAAALAHLALLRVRQIRDDADNRTCRRRLARVRHDQQLHDVVVHIPETPI